MTTNQLKIQKTAAGVEFVRTPDSCFENVRFSGINYKPQYVEIDGMRVHYVEAGPKNGQPILLLHGEPTWSYLYRKMLPIFAAAGYRAIAMDFIGAGRSDKPIQIEYFNYVKMADQIQEFINQLGLKDVTFVGQDWGAYIGLRTVGMNPDSFARVVLMNGQLPVLPEGMFPYKQVPEPNEMDASLKPFYTNWPHDMNGNQLPFRDENGKLTIDVDFHKIFAGWMAYTLKSPTFKPHDTVDGMTWFPLSERDKQAYDAPFPSREYMALPRYWPSMMLQVPGLNRDAWEGLTRFEKPFIIIYAPNDPGILGSAETYQKYIDLIPGAKNQEHSTISEASHFLQEDQGEEIARRIVEFMQKNSI